MTTRPDGDAKREELPHNVKVLGAVSFAQDTGSEMLYPLLPTFLTGVLGAPVVAVGVAEGLADATAAGMRLVAGRLAGARHRRPWIAAGYGLAAVGKVIVALAFVWPVVLLGRVVDRFGKGVRGVPRDALIADESGAAGRGRAFGFHRALDTSGAVLGPLLGLLLLRLLGGHIRLALLVATVPALVSVALVGLVREHQRSGSDVGGPVEPATTPTRDPLPADFWRALAPLAMFSLVNSTDALLLQRSAELGLTVEQVVLAYVLYNVVYAGLSYPAGVLADRHPPRWLIAGGLGVFAAAYVGLGLASTGRVVWLLLPVYGAYAALTDGVSRSWISGLVGPQQRTWALGVHGATTGAGVLVAGLWSGLAWQGDGRLPLTLSGCIAAVVAAWLLLDGTCRRTAVDTRSDRPSWPVPSSSRHGRV